MVKYCRDVPRGVVVSTLVQKKLALLSMLVLAACSAGVGDDPNVESSEDAIRVRPAHLDPNKAGSLEVRLPGTPARVATVELFVAGTRAGFGTKRWFEGPVSVEVALCYGVDKTYCATETVRVAPKRDLVLDLGALSVSLPPKDPPPPPPPRPDFGPKAYGASSQPDWLPSLVRREPYAGKPTTIVPTSAQGLLPNVAEALGAGGPTTTWAVPVFPATYQFGARGFDGNTGDRMVYSTLNVAPRQAQTVSISRNRYSPSIPSVVTVRPPVRELPDAIVQRFDMVIATTKPGGIFQLNVVPPLLFPAEDTNQWGEHHDPIAFRTVGGPHEPRSVIRSLALPTNAATSLTLYRLRPLSAPKDYDGAYFFVLNATQAIEVPGRTIPKIGRIDVEDVAVTNEQSGAQTTVSGTWRLRDARDQLVYGDRVFATNRGLDVLPGDYVVEVSFMSPWTGPQQQRHSVRVE